MLCFSLIVLQCSVDAAVTAVKYLGLPAPYATQSISPSIYPLRTALDVLQPSFPRYAFSWPAAAPAPAGYYPAPVVSVQSPLFSAPAVAPVVPTKILVKVILTKLQIFFYMYGNFFIDH